MKVTFPESKPAGFKADSVFKVINYPAAWIASASGQAYVSKGAVLFKFYNFHDDVRIVVDIAKSRGSDYLDYAEIDVPRKGGDRFVLFEDFPPHFRAAYCYYELWLVSMSKGRMDQSTAVNVQILYRPKP